jgi:hypothetical protein
MSGPTRPKAAATLFPRRVRRDLIETVIKQTNEKRKVLWH